MNKAQQSPSPSITGMSRSSTNGHRSSPEAAPWLEHIMDCKLPGCCKVRSLSRHRRQFMFSSIETTDRFHITYFSIIRQQENKDSCHLSNHVNTTQLINNQAHSQSSILYPQLAGACETRVFYARAGVWIGKNRSPELMPF